MDDAPLLQAVTTRRHSRVMVSCALSVKLKRTLRRPNRVRCPSKRLSRSLRHRTSRDSFRIVHGWSREHSDRSSIWWMSSSLRRTRIRITIDWRGEASYTRSLSSKKRLRLTELWLPSTGHPHNLRSCWLLTARVESGTWMNLMAKSISLVSVYRVDLS